MKEIGEAIIQVRDPFSNKLRDDSPDDWLGRILHNSFNPDPRENPRAIVAIIVVSCVLLGSILLGAVTANARQFWNFLNNVTPSEIEKIEVQRTDNNGIGISDPITVTDQVSIANFVAASKTVQEDSLGYRFPTENETKVMVWLKNHHTVEFECYTIKDSGKTVSVGYVWVKPNIYSFGSGNAHFPELEFYNWLLSIGVDVK